MMRNVESSTAMTPVDATEVVFPEGYPAHYHSWLSDALWRFGIKVGRKTDGRLIPAFRKEDGRDQLVIVPREDATESEAGEYDSFVSNLAASAAKVAAKRQPAAQPAATPPAGEPEDDVM